MKILIVEPYMTGSHAYWAEGYRSASRNAVELLTLPGRSWKWRMHGGAVTLARELMERAGTPDLILATDMCDLTTLLSLTRKRTSSIPSALYFHENQLTYPWDPDDRDIAKGRDRHYGFINYSSALAADRVYFNSRFHMDSFLSSLEGFLKNFPEHNELPTIDAIRQKSRVLYLGLDLHGLDAAGDVVRPQDRPPLILWNHRWEHDKNPGEFFQALYEVAEKGLVFEVALLGENFSNRPVEFEEAAKRLGPRIIHSGFAEKRPEYARWLRRADILPVTSRHDFFGCSVVEAAWSGCHPILPGRLAYPEHIPPELHERHLYDDFEGLVKRLEWAISNVGEIRRGRGALRKYLERYDWSRMAGVYDGELEALAAGSRRNEGGGP